MFDRGHEDDDDDEDEYVAAPPPPIQVTAHLRGGPHDGEQVGLPWPRLKLPMMTWDGEDQVESVYEMQGRWIGHQRDMDYQYVDPTPAVVVPIGRPRARRARRALLAARDAWRKAA